jgi:tRNA threonylcarbamoyladenosine biosynthesis protein TsaB
VKILLINTCGSEGVAALADTGAIAVERLPGRGSSEMLVPAVRRLLAGTGVAGLDAVGVVYGPGSFTGVRVGLSAAKGICDAGAIGMVAMSRLALVAGDDGVALLDAGRGEFYCGEYAGGQVVSEKLLRADDVTPLLLGRKPKTCEPKVVELVQQRLGLAVELIPEPGAEEMLAMVQRRLAAGSWSDVATVDANYMRRTDAELLMGAK